MRDAAEHVPWISVADHRHNGKPMPMNARASKAAKPASNPQSAKELAFGPLHAAIGQLGKIEVGRGCRSQIVNGRHIGESLSVIGARQSQRSSVVKEASAPSSRVAQRVDAALAR